MKTRELTLAVELCNEMIDTLGSMLEDVRDLRRDIVQKLREDDVFKEKLISLVKTQVTIADGKIPIL